MISMMLFDQDIKEGQSLIEYSKNAVAHCSEDALTIVNCEKERQARQFLEKKELLDTAFVDVTNNLGLQISKEVRQAYELSELLVIADETVSPMEYLTPEIRASSLLLRPFDEKQGKRIVQQFFQSFYRWQNTSNEDKVFVIENRQGKVSIPYSKIYYIEVREKKVFIRLKEKEYSKYDTMENLVKELPDSFIRCHRSFVVNKNYISRIKLSENVIYLDDTIEVPLSRSYKADIKAYIKELKEGR
jgi:DNA-binding LytR/AlgR family response regulator